MQVSPSPLIDDVAAVYHLAPLHALPSFDAAVTLKHSLPTRVHHAFDRLLRRRRWLWRLLYFLGLTYRFVGMALPLRMGGGWWLLLSPLAQLLPVAFTVLSLRRDFLSLMVRTFDFWFFGLVNTLSLIGFWLAFRDARAVLLPLGLVEIENARLSDAHCGSNIMPFIVIIAAVGTVYYGGLAAAVSLHLAEIHSTPLWRTPRGLVMTSEDVLVNSTVTLALLLARLAYRKRDALRSTRGDKSMVQCISYRSRLKFVAGRDTRSSTRSKREDAKVQLLAVVGSRMYDASDCVLGRQTWGASTGQRWFWRWKLAVLVAITLSLFHCTRAVVQGLAREPLTRVARALLVANAAANIAAVLPLFVFQQRPETTGCSHLFLLRHRLPRGSDLLGVARGLLPVPLGARARRRPARRVSLALRGRDVGRALSASEESLRAHGSPARGARAASRPCAGAAGGRPRLLRSLRRGRSSAGRRRHPRSPHRVCDAVPLLACPDDRRLVSPGLLVPLQGLGSIRRARSPPGKRPVRASGPSTPSPPLRLTPTTPGEHEIRGRCLAHSRRAGRYVSQQTSWATESVPERTVLGCRTFRAWVVAGAGTVLLRSCS